MSTEIANFLHGFSGEQNQETLKQYMPEKEIRDRFSRVVKRAVQETPDLLQADLKSLYFACERAAQDKLMPDGKEGFLSIYNTKTKVDGQEVWIKKVQWQPMILGLRKILANNGFMISAEIVYENDEFFYELGDTPAIIHRPKMTGERGKIVRAYAIATDKFGNKYREVMDMDELEKVHQASKQPNSNVWKTWATEMYRKAVAKRLFKQLPLSDSFMEVISRDNQQFDMDKAPAVSDVAKDVQEHVRLAKPTKEVQLEPVITEDPAPVEPAVIHHSEPEPVEVSPTHVEEGWPEDEPEGHLIDPYDPDEPGPNEPDF